MRIFTVSVLLVLSLCAASAVAQEAPPAADENCRAAPDDNSGTENGTPGADADPQQPLSQRLEDCRGVLEPPPTGDTDMTEPPPEGGKTPVITPPDVPAQPPAD